MRWAGHEARFRDLRSAHIFVRNPEEERPKRRWEDNIKIMDFIETW
jgi:hypothetical protein